MGLHQEALIAMSVPDLDALYVRSPAGPIPDGPARGIALIRNRRWRKTFAQLTYLFAWQGKTFDAQRCRLTNRITPAGINAIAADVYVGTSRFDGGSSIVLDYSKTSIVARSIRDEVRCVSPGLYLGFAYWGEKRLIAFSLCFASEPVLEGVLDRAAATGALPQ